MEHSEMPATGGDAIAIKTEEKEGDESLRQADEIIDILAKAKRYRSGKNAKGLGKPIVTIFRWGLPAGLLSMLFILIMRFGFPTLLDRNHGSGWFVATEAIAYIGFGSAGFVLVSVIFLLWSYRGEIPDNEAHHAKAGYLLHEMQVRLLAVYPLAVLPSVGRFYAKRPLTLKGIQSILLGNTPVSLASAALVLAMVEQLYDMHAFALPNSDFLRFVWLCLFMLIYIGIVVWWFRSKEDYQRAILADAIVLATSRMAAKADP